MEKFTTLTATACPLGLSGVDTDQILPARYLKVKRAAGLGAYLFHDLRRDESGELRGSFPLNKPQWRDARILVAGRNFGGGSSREAAVYALYDAGVRCVIAPSFGDIFSQNATKNGLLTAVVSESDSEAITEAARALPVTVDLQACRIVCGNQTWAFSIDPARRERLINGWDDIAMTESFRAKIASFRANDAAANPWKYPA
ncbi:MAG TPA: 3-isopropylmalate dehydratase small subunit [Pseudolabrys sp.]|jgi:3-isopropylmalate/(R)-2-methylmalate dehydratase small subunit|nr:3-isopropylmalate dehydratase small subunit [Pseudolabrys sp.]